jgi:hypothetical protein
MTSPATEKWLDNMRQARETLEAFERFADSLDELEKVAPIPEDIYNMTANTVRNLRGYLSDEVARIDVTNIESLIEWSRLK